MENPKAFAEEIKSDSHHLSQTIKDAVKDSLESIKENFSDYYDKGKASAKQIEKKAEGKIKQYPIQSLLIATGVGLALGLLCRKK